MAMRKAKEVWLDVDPASLTRKQRRAMRVSLHDHTSPLGKIATEARSKYSRHIGAKQLARRAAPDDGTRKSMEADASGLPPDGDDRATSLPQNYWTIKLAPPGPPPAWVKVPCDPLPPHGLLCRLAYSTAEELMKRLRTLGNKTSQFTDSDKKFARVRITAGGFSVTYYPSYAAAKAYDQAAAAKMRPTARRAA